MSLYSHPEVAALVLAAGMGKRMNSDLAKVLHPMAGKPLLGHVLDTLDALGVGRHVVVIGHQRDRVREVYQGRADLAWAVQDPQCGTGHAVMMAAPQIEAFKGTLLVVCGDTPLLNPHTLHELLETHTHARAAVTVLSMRLPDPTGYGRIVRTADGKGIERIVEEKDATPEIRALDEVNSGIYAFDYPALAAVLSRLSTNNSQGEYYLTDTVTLLRDEGRVAAVQLAPDEREMRGINTPEQLSEAEAIWADLVAAGRHGRA